MSKNECNKILYSDYSDLPLFSIGSKHCNVLNGDLMDWLMCKYIFKEVEPIISMAIDEREISKFFRKLMSGMIFTLRINPCS